MHDIYYTRLPAINLRFTGRLWTYGIGIRFTGRLWTYSIGIRFTGRLWTYGIGMPFYSSNICLIIAADLNI